MYNSYGSCDLYALYGPTTMLHPTGTINEGGEAYLDSRSGGDVSTEVANARKMNQQVAEMSSNVINVRGWGVYQEEMKCLYKTSWRLRYLIAGGLIL